jgi:hypothetical protein
MRSRLDGFGNAFHLVCAEIVHDDDITAAQPGCENLLDVGEEDRA